jgi:hypothetical protein
MRTFITHLAAVYFGAGLSMGLVMNQVVPLSHFGVVYYAMTWPESVYCARPGAECFGQASYLPVWFGELLFEKEVFE